MDIPQGIEVSAVHTTGGDQAINIHLVGIESKLTIATQYLRVYIIFAAIKLQMAGTQLCMTIIQHLQHRTIQAQITGNRQIQV